MNTILGLAVLYSTIHFFCLQGKGFDDRTGYEKAVTVVGMVSITLIYIGIMFG